MNNGAGGVQGAHACGDFFVSAFRQDTSYVYNAAGLPINTYDEIGDILAKCEPVKIPANDSERFDSLHQIRTNSSSYRSTNSRHDTRWCKQVTSDEFGYYCEKVRYAIGKKVYTISTMPYYVECRSTRRYFRGASAVWLAFNMLCMMTNAFSACC